MTCSQTLVQYAFQKIIRNHAPNHALIIFPPRYCDSQNSENLLFHTKTTKTTNLKAIKLYIKSLQISCFNRRNFISKVKTREKLIQILSIRKYTLNLCGKLVVLVLFFCLRKATNRNQTT